MASDAALESCASRSGSDGLPDSSLSDDHTNSGTWEAAVEAAGDARAAGVQDGDIPAAEVQDGDIPEAGVQDGDTPGAEAAETCSSCRAEPGPQWRRSSQERQKERAREQETFSWSILLSSGTIVKIFRPYAATIATF